MLLERMSMKACTLIVHCKHSKTVILSKWTHADWFSLQIRLCFVGSSKVSSGLILAKKCKSDWAIWHCTFKKLRMIKKFQDFEVPKFDLIAANIFQLELQILYSFNPSVNRRSIPSTV